MKWSFDKTKDYRAEHMQKATKYRLAQQAEQPRREDILVEKRIIRRAA
jgi:hypothetical protein